MGLVKRTNGYWYVRVKRDGRAHWKSLRTRKRPTAGEAAVAQVALWEELSRRGHAGFAAGTPPARELASDYVAGLRAGSSEAYARRVEATFAVALRTLPADVQGWTPALVHRYLDRRAPALSPHTLVTERQHLGQFTRWARRRGHLAADPCADIDRPKARLAPPRPPTTAALKLVLHAARGYDRRLEERDGRAWLERAVRFAYSTGLRRGELAGLEWRDVRLARGEIRVRAATSKSKRDRTVPLTRRARRALSTVPQAERKGLVFAQLARRHESDNILNQLTGSVGFQELRQWFCSLLALRRVQPSVVQRVAGHADIRTTLRHYVGISDAHVRSEVADSGL